MRFRKTQNKVTVHAVTGTYVVMLGIDMAKADADGLLGFAIHRTDPKENEAYWLPGMRTFEASYPHPPAGALVSTRDHPVQDFLWSDFTAKAGRKYVYRVDPVYGKPKNLRHENGVTIEVETEKETGAKHSIFFNRAVIGSQAYSRKFNEPPNKLKGQEKEDAYRWLSRGLIEAITRFLAEAKDASFAVRAAVYELSEDAVGAAFGKALTDCGDVQIVYDGRIPKKKDGTPDPDSKSRVDKAKRLLSRHGLAAIATPRKQNPAFISHNKFIILLKDGDPVAVWTGSTNLTESGIFGHANVGHLVRDRKVAAAFLKYWERLREDPEVQSLKDDNESATPTLTEYPPPAGTTVLFSPRNDLDQLEWYGQAMDNSSQLFCFTAAFGVNAVFREVFRKNKAYLRYVFLEKWGVNPKLAEETEADLSNDRDIQVAVGATIRNDILYRWLHEMPNTLSRNVRYVHTKFMLIDPLHDTDPVVISGSANFSDASTKSNDENMLVIRGDKRVADIYLGEFMRLWRHHRFRSIVNKIDDAGEVVGPNYLDPTDAWTTPFFKDGSVKFKRRTTFA